LSIRLGFDVVEFGKKTMPVFLRPLKNSIKEDGLSAVNDEQAKDSLHFGVWARWNFAVAYLSLETSIWFVELKMLRAICYMTTNMQISAVSAKRLKEKRVFVDWSKRFLGLDA
jgi:hypothetical protein